MTGRQYVALLRAINVGKRMVKMSDLKRLFEQAGFDEVATFIASGNVVFRSPSKDPAKLEGAIEATLQKALGFPVVTFLRTTEEIADIAGRHPFQKQMPPGARLYVGFLREAPPASVRRMVASLGTPTDEFAIRGRELYWRCATPSMQSIHSGATLEKALKMPATLRNINTVLRLAAKYPPA